MKNLPSLERLQQRESELLHHMNLHAEALRCVSDLLYLEFGEDCRCTDPGDVLRGMSAVFAVFSCNAAALQERADEIQLAQPAKRAAGKAVQR